MNEGLGYIKYSVVGFILSSLTLGWGDIGQALLLGFAGAVGGFLARLLTNYLKKRWEIFRTK
ncbi:hypothetical protein LCGC14_0388820 [marine sediment metagenome]|uniref:Uncharacterized protein n=1 Tax=marine sediment metagenome TaxID=412755 RepID=A0A0F9T0D5_9ZZZZ